MSLTREEYEEIKKLVCPHCYGGMATRYRPETKEWVHDHVAKMPGGGGTITHGVCWATGLRTSHFNAGFEDGQPAKSD